MRLSVAVCTWNGERYIREQLDSILHQDVPVDEIVICDDASTDQTPHILQQYRLDYPQLIALHKSSENLGPVRNFERCIQSCSGDLIFLSDQDDRWHRDKTAIMSSYFQSNEDALLVFTDGALMDESGNRTESTLWEKWGFDEACRRRWKNNELAFDDLARNRNKVTGATLGLRKELKEHIFPFPPTNVHYWHDAWIALYAAKYNGLFFIEDSLIDYRIHRHQLVGIGNGTTVIGARDPFVKRALRKLNRVLGYES